MSGSRTPDLQYFSVPLKDPNDYFKTGETVLVFTSSEPVGDYLDRVLEVENTMMQEEPMVTKYPAYEGQASTDTAHLVISYDSCRKVNEFGRAMMLASAEA